MTPFLLTQDRADSGRELTTKFNRELAPSDKVPPDSTLGNVDDGQDGPLDGALRCPSVEPARKARHSAVERIV